MSQTLQRVRELVAKREVLISVHGYEELANDGLFVQNVLDGLAESKIIEDYPNYHKGPCVLVLQRDEHGDPVHVVWGIPKGKASPAVIVTAYRPDPNRWSEDFIRRRP